MIDKYEISLWEDFPDTTSGGVPFLNERKLCVIGSDTMRSQVRALEPKMVTNVNGTNTFTFKMYYRYIDNITGEFYTNPFINLLINERKVKVYWKDKWYDMLIKNIEEDTGAKTVTYTCKDLFITELSKNGYDLEFSADLQNNIGTASQLAAAVLENSGWQFDAAGSSKIIQKTEEPVYEATVLAQFNATKQSPIGDTSNSIAANKTILVFYSSVIGINTTEERTVDVQFLYAEEGYATDENDMLVTNGDCYTMQFTAYQSGGYVYLLNGTTTIATINTTAGVSNRYRAERLVKSQITKYDKLFDRYVNVYQDSQNNNKEVWGYNKTEFSDPLAIINLVANSSNFKNTDGWIGEDITWGVYPKFTSNSSVTTYAAKSYLKIAAGDTYNSGLGANQAFLKPTQGDIKQGDIGGFHVGDKYIFRVKVKTDGADPSATSYKHDDTVTPIISTYNSDYESTGSNYFSVGTRTVNGDWNEYLLTCTTAKAATEIEELGLFLRLSTAVWIEDVEFFKYAVGITSYASSTEQRINPGEISLQGIGKTIYRYYNADHDNAEAAEEVTFLYEGEEQPARFVPQTNNYEKITSIEANSSNRFNILQSIAENFECWVKFTINHDSTGKMTFDSDGLPQKYVTLVDYIGEDLGWSFEYGIDLRTIKRKIISDNITTKIIVLPNENEYAPSGFCTIARSNLNYAKENFILNLDYFINQGLLDQDMLNRDLYSSSDNYIGYYYYLHKYNKEYDEITELLAQKNIELVKQKSQLVVLENQQKATLEKIDSSKSDVMTLACVTTWAAAQSYAVSHSDNTKVQTLMNTIAQLQNTYNKNATQLTNLGSSLSTLEGYITSKEARQSVIIQAINALHISFFKKYARFLQEGTWQNNDYVDDDKYYLDAVEVAYTSSRPQLQYEINVTRLSALEDFSSKTFNVGDICYIQDREYFGYGADGITPFKLKITISEITSFFDTPDKDTIKVQNYKTQFDDLFQRITATTQSLQYQEGSFQKAAGAINHDNTLSFDLLQDTFDYNENWVLNASNQHVTWDSTGITVTDDKDSALQMRIMAGGLFISNDGGASWKNAVRGDGISTDVLTAGRVNTNEIFVYDGSHPSFRWDSAGINAYFTDALDVTNFGKYVRFDRFGLYGYQGSSDFVPSTESAIWDNSDVKFGLTWRGFFLRGSNNIASLNIADTGSGITFELTSGVNTTDHNIASSLEISTANDILLKTKSKYNSVTQEYEDVNRIQIGRYEYLDNGVEKIDYGIFIRDANGNNIFNVSAEGNDSIGGWNLTQNSFYQTNNGNTIGLYSSGQSATIQGHTDSYYILAGNKFGVTIDGNVYAYGGKIGGWTINNDSLTGGNITLDSAGNIKCDVNGSNMWKIDNTGKGYFYNIEAKGGYVAGWHIDNDKIWNDNGTTLSAAGQATYNVNRYTIVTNSIAASGGSIGGCSVSAGSISGGSWSLSSGGGNIGGWTIDANRIYGSDMSLYSSGSISMNGTSITGHTNGKVSVSGSMWISSGLEVSGESSLSGKIHVPSIEFFVNNVGDGTTLTKADVEGLHGWKKSGGGYYSPNEVWVEGANTVWISNYGIGLREVNGVYYRHYAIDNSTVLYISADIGLSGTDMDNHSFTLTNQPSSQPINLDISDVYNSLTSSSSPGYKNGYNEGAASVTVSTLVATRDNNGNYYYFTNGGENISAYISVTNTTHWTVDNINFSNPLPSQNLSYDITNLYYQIYRHGIDTGANSVEALEPTYDTVVDPHATVGNSHYVIARIKSRARGTKADGTYTTIDEEPDDIYIVANKIYSDAYDAAYPDSISVTSTYNQTGNNAHKYTIVVQAKDKNGTLIKQHPTVTDTEAYEDGYDTAVGTFSVESSVSLRNNNGSYYHISSNGSSQNIFAYITKTATKKYTDKDGNNHSVPNNDYTAELQINSLYYSIYDNGRSAGVASVYKVSDSITCGNIVNPPNTNQWQMSVDYSVTIRGKDRNNNPIPINDPLTGSTTVDLTTFRTNSYNTGYNTGAASVTASGTVTSRALNSGRYYSLDSNGDATAYITLTPKTIWTDTSNYRHETDGTSISASYDITNLYYQIYNDVHGGGDITALTPWSTTPDLTTTMVTGEMGASQYTGYSSPYLYAFFNASISGRSGTQPIRIKIHANTPYNEGYTAGYTAGQSSVAKITAVNMTTANNIVWDANDKTVGASFNLYAKDSNDNILFTEIEYPITIPANKAWNNGYNTGYAIADQYGYVSTVINSTYGGYNVYGYCSRCGAANNGAFVTGSLSRWP